jgi:hypothetical protein
MQVEQQPSPWPTVVVLACLVLFCLTVPRHWRKPANAIDDSGETPVIAQAEPRKPARSVLAFPSFGFDWAGRPLGFENGGMHTWSAPGQDALDRDLLSLWEVPSIDELVAARFGTSNLNDNPIGWPTWEPVSDSAISDPSAEQLNEELANKAATIVDAVHAGALDRMGRAIVAYAPANLLPRLAVKAVRAYQIWSTPQVARQDGLVRLPEDEEPTPVIVPDEEGLKLEPETDPWCDPRILFEQLLRIAQHDFSREWAERTLAELHLLTDRNSLDGEDVQAILAELGVSAQDAMRMAETVEDDRLRVELLRAHWALARRLDRWSVAHEIRMAARAGERVAARGSLEHYLAGAPDHAARQSDGLTLALESYEATRDPQLGRQIVSEQRALAQSSDALDRSLADAVEQHYRNANIRVAISAEMLNRYVGQERSDVRPLRDRVGGATVRGQSHLKSSSRVELEPATGRWDLDVESQGTIASSATADGGQAQFRSQTATDFSARKRIVVDATGVLLQPASIDVDSHNRLTGVTTDFDWMPLFATYARDRAVREYRARQQRAKMEVESKVAGEAVRTIDQETQEAVTRVEKQIRERVTDRLAKFGVKVTPVELTTTHERVVARLRVASDDQAGSHTPRPRALSDSLASAQIHETALTNAAVSLEFDGMRYTAAELVELLQKKFPQAMLPQLDEEKRETIFQFAKQDAVQFHIEDGRLEVTLSLVSVEVDGRRMRNFVVHAFYMPAVDGLEAELVRDGSLGIEGRLSSGDRARLHNVFNSVLPPERRVPIVQVDDKSDPRLAGLMITQLVLEDGWLGLALGPISSERVAERSRSLK